MNTVTQELIDSKIKSESFTVLPSGKTMVCELILENGYSVRGEASVGDIETFNKSKGEDVSRKNAVSKIWTLEWYLEHEGAYYDNKS